jgi:hypothetical protein
VTRRHRLGVEADRLAQAPRDAPLRVRELDPLGPDPTPRAGHPSLTRDQRQRMPRPRQVIPRPIPCRPHPTGASPAATARIPSGTASLHPNPHPSVRGGLVPLHLLHPEAGRPQNPRTIGQRSHASSLLASTTRENDTGWSGAKWDRFDAQAAEQTAHPNSGLRRRPSPTSYRCTQIGEEPRNGWAVIIDVC